MLTYNIFKEVITDNLIKYLDDSYDVSFVKMEKVNGSKDAVTVKKDEDKVGTVFYLDSLYNDYKKNESIDETLKSISGFIMSQNNNDKLTNIREQVKSVNEYNNDIVYFLLNTDANRNLLLNMPNRKLPGTDLSIVYRKVISNSDTEIKSTFITNELQKELGMSEKDLYTAAQKDTERLLPTEIKSVFDVLYDMAGIIPDMDNISESDFLIITNELGINGAAAIINKDNLDKAAEIIGGDIYLIPSSIHECLALPAGDIAAEEIQKMVSEINDTCVEVSERLSNNVYKYDSQKKVLSQVTFVSNRNLTKKVNNEFKKTPKRGIR